MLILNSNLKTAHSLLDDGRTIGALYQGLLVRLKLASIAEKNGALSEIEDMLLAWELANELIDMAAADSSMARLFCQQVGSILEDPSPDPAELRQADLLLKEILPLLLGN